MNQSLTDDGEDNNEDNEENENEYLKNFTEEQKNRYLHFKSVACKFPHEIIHSKMNAALSGTSTKISANSDSLVGFSAKLFAAQLIDTARSLMDNDGPIPPDMILLAYHELETRGVIPGKGVGVKISDYK